MLSHSLVPEKKGKQTSLLKSGMSGLTVFFFFYICKYDPHTTPFGVLSMHLCGGGVAVAIEGRGNGIIYITSFYNFGNRLQSSPR